MSDFIDHLLETAAIQANSQRMFRTEDTMRPCFNPIEQHQELMRQYERDRDPIETVIKYAQDFPHGDDERDRESAASVTDPCHRCGRTVQCEPCQELHECFTEQVRDMMREGR